ncbi:heparinase II/III domain-containing protein [Rubellicoccus peritrichatus]|uniref:Heparinase II/III family protein n=1 Tax=Rubellicoccus peritrichatus TaxID=3080537 RepID=A0AAQ3L9B2_9BACT|nr:heparinase II/III family protein [Puniceicoccus sp. CR14]WOO41216.1 heparinase II/III family protein [Puniceicoccus sp. CR14]
MNRIIKIALSVSLPVAVLLCPLNGQNWQRPESLPDIPDTPPRTWILKDQQNAFRDYCTIGEGKAFFQNIKKGFDEKYLETPFPEEPESFGDSDPRKRTSAKTDAWRKAQDTSNLVAGIASTATIIWRVTGEEVYLKKSRDFLLKVTDWDPEGTTGIEYNDETNFRLLRLLPEVYDQIREEFTEAERQKIVTMFQVRGSLSFQHILDKRTGLLVRNSLLIEPSSHPVRFMPMMGLMGLALWDDIPEAKDWFAFAYRFYQDQFPPWGGDDGGWAEGMAYWRGVIEHVGFQDGLLLIKDPEAYSQPFWKNTFYFPVYFQTPWRATAFGDIPVAGVIGMEPGIYDAVNHAARIFNDGYLRSYADLYMDSRPLPEEDMEFKLWRKYPTPVEYLLRDFLVHDYPLPEALPLSELPQSKYFQDIGWVAMHSNLGAPDEDIFLQFKSSPYGSYSHSHADQNAFILSAYGEPLAINSGYREYHRSPHHKGHTRQTLSKNALLINKEGQPVQDKNAKGEITGFVDDASMVWVRGDATTAYRGNSKLAVVELAQRDILMLGKRFFVIRDQVNLSEPGNIQWLLHSVEPPALLSDENIVEINKGGSWLTTQLWAVENTLSYEVSSEFAVPVTAKYIPKGYKPQSHMTASTETPASAFTIYSLLWPSLKQGDTKWHIVDAKRDFVVLKSNDGKETMIDFSGDKPVFSQ